MENQSLQGAETDAGATVARNARESLEAPCGELKTTQAHFSGVSSLGGTPTPPPSLYCKEWRKFLWGFWWWGGESVLKFAQSYPVLAAF